MSHLPEKGSCDVRRDREALRVLLGGMLGMVVAMGIGRFVFTPILPLMQRDLAMSNTLAGWLAGLNYLGYLAGAVWCSLTPQILRALPVTGGALVLSIGTTLLMGLTTAPLWWGVSRLVGGIASAVLFIVITAEVSEFLSRRGYSHWLGALYGGIGVGIALSGLLVPPLDQFGGWAGAWLGSGIIAALLAAAGIALGRRGELISPLSVAPAVPLGGGLATIRWLVIAYFFEGLGYVVSATFLVAIIAATPGLAGFAPYSWVAVGIAALPSTIFWPYLARRVGNRKALLAAYLVQGGGIALSIGAETVVTVLLAAVAFGGTFLGIVAMTLSEGRRRAPHEGRRAAAILTASFGVGQMLGPVVAGRLADQQQGFTGPLLLATICVLLGAFFTLADRRF